MVDTTQALDDALANHPPFLDGGTWNDADDTRITAGDVLLKGDGAADYEPSGDIGDLTPLLVLNAGDAGIVYWNAEANAYGWYDEMFLREDWGRCLAHVERDLP